MQYIERLWVPLWWWIIVALLVVSAAVATFAYAHWIPSTLVTLGFLVGLGTLLVGYGSLALRVDDEAFQVGRFRLEARWIAGVEAFEGREAERVLGVDANHADFHVTRPYASGVVRVRLADPADPHPNWLIATRRPEQLARAIAAIVPQS